MKFIYVFAIVLLGLLALGTAQTVCTLQYDPVCATNGKTYGNSCLLKVAGAKFAYWGECRSGYKP